MKFVSNGASVIFASLNNLKIIFVQLEIYALFVKIMQMIMNFMVNNCSFSKPNLQKSLISKLT